MDNIVRIGWVPENSNNSIEAFIQTDDEFDIPHFHIREYSRTAEFKWDANKSKKNNTLHFQIIEHIIPGEFNWDASVKFEKAEYFQHGKHQDKLPNQIILRQLVSMLKAMNPKDTGRTYWQTAIIAWNNNSATKLPIDLEMPDYLKL